MSGLRGKAEILSSTRALLHPRPALFHRVEALPIGFDASPVGGADMRLPHPCARCTPGTLFEHNLSAKRRKKSGKARTPILVQSAEQLGRVIVPPWSSPGAQGSRAARAHDGAHERVNDWQT